MKKTLYADVHVSVLRDTQSGSAESAHHLQESLVTMAEATIIPATIPAAPKSCSIPAYLPLWVSGTMSVVLVFRKLTSCPKMNLAQCVPRKVVEFLEINIEWSRNC